MNANKNDKHSSTPKATPLPPPTPVIAKKLLQTPSFSVMPLSFNLTTPKTPHQSNLHNFSTPTPTKAEIPKGGVKKKTTAKQSSLAKATPKKGPQYEEKSQPEKLQPQPIKKAKSTLARSQDVSSPIPLTSKPPKPDLAPIPMSQSFQSVKEPETIDIHGGIVDLLTLLRMIGSAYSLYSK